MNKIKVVVFDLGNVLIPFDYGIIINRLNEIEKGLGDKFYNLYKNNYDIHREYERGNISTDGFTKIMLNWLDNKITAEKFYDIYANLFTTNDETIALLPKLKRNYRLFLLSNTNYIHQKYGWEKYGFFHNFEKLFLSHEVGAVKPERKIYEAVENYSKEEPSSHIFIDDVKEYVDGAKSLGWDGIQFLGHENLLKEFEKRGIIV